MSIIDRFTNLHLNQENKREAGIKEKLYLLDEATNHFWDAYKIFQKLGANKNDMAFIKKYGEYILEALEEELGIGK